MIDVFSGVSLLEIPFKEFQTSDKNIIFSKFFELLNRTIDDIRIEISKNNITHEFTNVFELNDSSFLIYYQPLAGILFCSISDVDDDTDKISEAIKRITHRFMKKHRTNLKLFRDTTEQTRFQTFTADIENFMLGGRIAEVFPKLLIARGALEKIYEASIISELELEIALLCDGKNSPFRISKNYQDRNKVEINKILKKLEQLDIIKI